LAIDEHGGRAEFKRAEMRADQLDFTQRQCGGGHNVVNARVRLDFSSGLCAGAGHDFDLNPNA
jgi:hypothetical protein